MADRLTLALRSVRDVDPNAGESGEADHLLTGGASGGAVTIIKSGKRSEVQTQ